MAVTPGTGLQATYYPNPDFTGAGAVTRVDKKIHFDFVAATPAPAIAPSTSSVRWTGKIKPAYTENYTFYTTADDGVRVWVNHKLVIDDWSRHAARERSGTIALTASKKVDIQVEYFNNTGEAVAQLWWSSPSQIKSVVPTARLYPEAQNLASKIDHAFAFAEAQIASTLTQINRNPNLYVNNTVGSGAPGTDGRWNTTDGNSWTAGFLAGVIWEAYKHNPKKSMRLDATAWTNSLADNTSLPDDNGFRIRVPFKNLAPAEADATLLAAANAKMAAWDATVGMFRSSGGTTLSTNPAGDFAVLIDHSMDMELLYWAWRKTGNASYRDRATAHLLKLAQNYVRGDGSTAQWGYYNSTGGLFVGHDKKQGASADSTWSRGQAWAIHAYTAAFRETSNASILATAQKVADYFIAHSPTDGIPNWDFEDTTRLFKDTSAAAIAASGMLELSGLITDATLKAKYRAAAEKILTSLTAAPYLAEGSTSRGILLHGASFVPRKASLPDNSLIYGDYYFLEAMNRYTFG